MCPKLRNAGGIQLLPDTVQLFPNYGMGFQGEGGGRRSFEDSQIFLGDRDAVIQGERHSLFVFQRSRRVTLAAQKPIHEIDG
ncbi:MAG: hypothetical protein ACREP8_12270, partial [Candidatus Binatia bacterium]